MATTEDGRGFYANFERLPAHLIQHAWVNEEMLQNAEDPELRRFLSVDYLIKNAAYMGFGPHQNGRTFLQSPTMGRGFALKYGKFKDDAGVRHGLIFAKGTGIGKTAFRPSKKDPRGFFGERHAVQDEYLSNLFARFGGRTARSIGGISLDTEKLRKFLAKPSRNRVYTPNDELEKVTNNGDFPSIHVRIAEADRSDEIPSYSERNSKRNWPYTNKLVMDRAFSVLQDEVQDRGADAFSQRYEVPGQIMDAINGQERTEEVRARIFEHFVAFNIGVFNEMKRRIPELGFSPHTGNLGVMGMFVDWENSLHVSGQHIEGDFEDFSLVNALDPLFIRPRIAGEQIAMERGREITINGPLSQAKH